MNHMLVIIVVVAVGTLVWLGVLIGSEAQKHILRGHEGTRAETLRRQRRLRAEHVRRRQIQLYGRPLSAVPDPRPPWNDDEKWWRRHPSGEGSVRRAPDGSDHSP